jgi:hypothetical protein
VLTPFIGVAGVQRLVYPARSRRAVIAQYPLAGGFGRWRAARWPHQFAVRQAPARRLSTFPRVDGFSKRAKFRP